MRCSVDTVAGAWLRGERHDAAKAGKASGWDRQKMTETFGEDTGHQAKMSHARARNS
jgi:hypothetical protein